MFTDEELQALAVKESRARQQMENSSYQQLFSRSPKVSQSNTTVNDAKYRAEFKAGKYQMTEDQFVSLRRSEDGLEEFIPSKPAAAPTDAALNPLASELRESI